MCETGPPEVSLQALREVFAASALNQNCWPLCSLSRKRRSPPWMHLLSVIRGRNVLTAVSRTTMPLKGLTWACTAARAPSEAEDYSGRISFSPSAGKCMTATVYATGNL